MVETRITTPCPSCGGKTLFVGSGGHLTCSWVECPEPVVERAIKLIGRRSITIDDPHTLFVPRIKVDGEWLVHVRCEGATFHVISYSNLGQHCSEPMCIVNKP
jgi:hypothetical protein